MRAEFDFTPLMKRLESLDFSGEDRRKVFRFSMTYLRYPYALVENGDFQILIEEYQKKLGTGYAVLVFDYDPRYLVGGGDIPFETEQAFCFTGAGRGVIFLPQGSVFDPGVTLAHELGHIHLHSGAVEKGGLEEFQSRHILEVEKAADRIAAGLCGVERTMNWLSELSPYRDEEHFAIRLSALKNYQYPA